MFVPCETYVVVLHLRVLDMSHDLVRQTKEKPRQSFGIVKERIVTTQPCFVIEDVQLGGECGGGLSLCGLRSPKVHDQNQKTQTMK